MMTMRPRLPTVVDLRGRSRRLRALMRRRRCSHCERTALRRVRAASGLTFTHVNGATGQYYMAEQMGAGVALFDYDNDGDLDVFLVQGGPLDARPHPRPRARRRGCFGTT